MNFYDNKGNVRVEFLRKRVLGEEVCYSCNFSINPIKTMFPVSYYRIIVKNGRVERSCLVHELCFRDIMEESLGKHITFIPAKMPNLDSIV